MSNSILRYARLNLHICARRSFTFFLTALLGGCSFVGPSSISYDRIDYNEVLQSTGVEQTLLNILRVQNNEMPVFLDITEVDAARTLAGSLSGGATSIGATGNPKTTAGFFGGALGSITGATSYSDQPTVRYQPVGGQALVAQINTPLSVTSLASFVNSTHLPLASVLTLSLARSTPSYSDRAAAENALIALDQYGAVRFAATETPKKQENGAKGGTTVTINNPQTSLDNLTIYAQKRGFRQCGNESPETVQENVEKLWKRLKDLYYKGYGGSDPLAITLNAKSRPAPAKSSTLTKKPTDSEKPAELPLLITHSAVDIMWSASPGHHTYQADAQTIREIIVARKNAPHLKPLRNCDLDFYMVDNLDNPKSQNEKDFLIDLRKLYDDGVYPNSIFLLGERLPTYNLTIEKREALLSKSRTLMLIGYSDDRPADAYVSVLYKRKWYSIFDDDFISKQTLSLIHQFNIVQAAPPQSPPLTPTISVGAR
jgi:hypothetical protein